MRKERRGIKQLKTIIKQELKEDEHIFILRREEVAMSKGVMHEHTIDDLWDFYSPKDWVTSFWHEDGLCIILK